MEKIKNKLANDFLVSVGIEWSMGEYVKDSGLYDRRGGDAVIGVSDHEIALRLAEEFKVDCVFRRFPEEWVAYAVDDEGVTIAEEEDKSLPQAIIKAVESLSEGEE